MNLAVLGTDRDLLRLAAAAKDEGHQIVWLADVRPEDADAISELLPHVEQSGEWELVLDRGTADAVLVGRGTASSELRAEQLKRLAAEAMPMLVVHPACESVLAYYEIDMARREMGGIVRHYNPAAGHPIVETLARWAHEAHPAIGPIHQVTCERRVADGSRAGVVAHLARDTELLAAVAGDVRRVTAIGPKADAASFASLQVQMTCRSAASTRWSVGSVAGADLGATLTLIGERGSFALRVPEDSEMGSSDAWQLDHTGGGQRDFEPLPPFDPAVDAIQQLAAAVAETDSQRRAASSTWESATRAMEVVDAVVLSLEKGRTIDVHQQQLTERLAFRGTMAAVGCGLLLLGFAAVVLVTMLGGAEAKPRGPLFPSWPLALLAVFGFFLLLQALPLMIGKKNRPNEPDDDGPFR